MQEGMNSWTERIKDNLTALLLTGILSLGTWLVQSVNEQNVRLAELLIEVKVVNERLGQYATKSELKELEKRLDLHIAEGKKH